VQNRIRSVGGRLYVTDRRLLFARTKVESPFGGREWSAPFSNFKSASQGRMGRVKIVRTVGPDERFFVESAREAAAVVNATVRAQDA
jgi:hypothetical protein